MDSWIEFCDLAGAVDIDSRTPLILEIFEEKHSDKDGESLWQKWMQFHSEGSRTSAFCFWGLLGRLLLEYWILCHHIYIMQNELCHQNLLVHLTKKPGISGFQELSGGLWSGLQMTPGGPGNKIQMVLRSSLNVASGSLFWIFFFESWIPSSGVRPLVTFPSKLKPVQTSTYTFTLIHHAGQLNRVFSGLFLWGCVRPAWLWSRLQPHAQGSQGLQGLTQAHKINPSNSLLMRWACKEGLTPNVGSLSGQLVLIRNKTCYMNITPSSHQKGCLDSKKWMIDRHNLHSYQGFFLNHLSWKAWEVLKSPEPRLSVRQRQRLKNCHV